ncbi:MAG: hypothetical protein R3B70_29860 [Polyangiaceae bacterium]
MLTCRLPYDAPNEFARLTAVFSEDPKPIEQVAPHLQSWSGFFRKAIASEASDLPDRRGDGQRHHDGPPRRLPRRHLTAASTAPPAPTRRSPAPLRPDWVTLSGPRRPPATRPGTGTVYLRAFPATFQGNSLPGPRRPCHVPWRTGRIQRAQPLCALPGSAPSASPQHLPERRTARPIASIPMAPMAGEGRQNNTHVSAHAPPGVPMPLVAPAQCPGHRRTPQGMVPVWIGAKSAAPASSSAS